MVVVSTSFSPPIEGVLLQTPSTKLLIGEQEVGTGTLYITENNVVWGGGIRPSGVAAPAVSILYPRISLHAVQRVPTPALFLALDYELRLPELSQPAATGDSEEGDEDDFDSDENQTITQLRFVPQNENDLSAMYTAMCQGQELHPDPADEVENDDDYMDGVQSDDDEEFEDAEESNSSPEEAASRMRQMRLDNSNGNAQHFDDAEDGIEE